MTTGRRSLRFRLTAMASLLVFAALVVASVAVVLVQRQALRSSVDSGLRQRADAIEAGLATPGVPTDDLLLSVDPDDRFAQIIDPSGSVVAGTPGAPSTPITLAVPTDDVDVIEDLDHPQFPEGPHRVLTRRVELAGQPATLNVSQTLEDVSESLSVLALSFAVMVPVLSGLIGWLAWWLTGRALAPVEAIRSQVADIDGRGLDRRVPVPDTGDEIARLAETMNAMLGRVQSASDQQQQFVADASHELRSPLTRIRSELEVDLAHPDRADLVATHERVLAESAELERLVDDLLYLARSDAGAMSVGRAVVDLDDIVLAEADRIRERGRLAVDIGRVSAAQVEGDRRQLARVVRNLVDNAERHARAEVSFGLAEVDGHAVLEVGDDGRGIDPVNRTRIFERFTRLDDARTRDGGGTGLGLAIASDIVDRHGGSISVADDGQGRGAVFRIELPLAT